MDIQAFVTHPFVSIVLLAVVIFFVVKAIINSIRLFFFVLVAALILVFFFNISLSDVLGVLSAARAQDGLTSLLLWNFWIDFGKIEILRHMAVRRFCPKSYESPRRGRPTTRRTPWRKTRLGLRPTGCRVGHEVAVLPPWWRAGNFNICLVLNKTYKLRSYRNNYDFIYLDRKVPAYRV